MIKPLKGDFIIGDNVRFTVDGGGGKFTGRDDAPKGIRIDVMHDGYVFSAGIENSFFETGFQSLVAIRDVVNLILSDIKEHNEGMK